MSRLRHSKGVRAGAGSGVHRAEEGKPLPFSPDEERKHGGKVSGEKKHHRLGRKRGGSVKDLEERGPGVQGTDVIPDRGRKFGTKLEETRLDEPDKIEDRRQYADGGKIDWLRHAIKHPGAEKRAAKKAGESTHEYMEEHKHDSGKSGNRARLGLRLSAMAKHKD